MKKDKDLSSIRFSIVIKPIRTSRKQLLMDLMVLVNNVLIKMLLMVLIVF